MIQNTQTVIVNFGDEATTWFREIAAAVQSSPEEIHIQFVGGACPPAFETVSLRNVLLQIPKHIKLVTIAACSLPPLTCAAWMVGDERHIAGDAEVWIPNLPEHLMNSALKSYKLNTWEESGNEIEVDGEEDSEDENIPGAGPSQSYRRRRSKNGLIMAGPRHDKDISILCEAINEWFPSWEFMGSCLSVADLIEWNVIQPEWTFGGRSPRTRHLPAPSAKPGTSAAKRKPASKTKQKAAQTTKQGSLPLLDDSSDGKSPRRLGNH